MLWTATKGRKHHICMGGMVNAGHADHMRVEQSRGVQLRYDTHHPELISGDGHRRQRETSHNRARKKGVKYVGM